MANISKLNDDTRTAFEQLFFMGIPFRVVAAAMEVNDATAKKYFKKLMGKDWEVVKGRPASQLRMLELYSSWVADPDSFKLIAAGTKKDLLGILWNELEFDALTMFLIGMLGASNYFCTPQFADGISENEKEFITHCLYFRTEGTADILPTRKQAHAIIETLMKELHDGTIQFPTVDEFSKKADCYIRLIQSQLPEIKKRIVPMVTIEMRDLLKEMVLGSNEVFNFTEQEQTILEHFYKLGWTTVDNDYLNVKEERQRQIRDKAVIKIQIRSRSFLFRFEKLNEVLSQARKEKKELEEALQSEKKKVSDKQIEISKRDELVKTARKKGFLTDDELLAVGERVDTLSNGYDITLLLTSINDLDISVRAFNCCIDNKIYDLAGLVKHTPNDLLKFRNFGKKSLIELEAMLIEKGLKFGIEFTETDLALLEARRKQK